MIVINFKNYVYGKKALGLAKKIQTHLRKAIVCVPTTNINEIDEKTKLQVFSQHVDLVIPKKSTGFITPKSVKETGAKGTLLNHSEHKIKLVEIKKTIEECNKINLRVIVCASNLMEAKEIKKFKPFAIAFEDPKLIATGKSITKYKANDLKKFVSLLRNTKIILLCGAGINSGEDYFAAKKLGCKGILVSSAVANSQNPEKFLKEVS